MLHGNIIEGTTQAAIWAWHASSLVQDATYCSKAESEQNNVYGCSVMLENRRVTERMGDACRQVQPMLWLPNCQLMQGVYNRHLHGESGIE